MSDAAQRQRRLAAKAARRKAVVAAKRMLEAASSSLPGRIRVAAKGPVLRCVRTSSLFEIGIGHVIIARLLPSNLVGAAFFLVDTLCLGIKDVFYQELGQSELKSRLSELDDMQSLTTIEPAYARKLIRDAAAYAAGLGLTAAKDTPTIEAIFGDIDEADCTETFTFGKDSKPFFVNGPNDSPARIRAIGQALDKTQTRGGWDYTVEVQPELLSLIEQSP